MIETKIPSGNSEFFKITRHKTSAHIKKIPPTMAQTGISRLTFS